jgi:hypothetical protein
MAREITVAVPLSQQQTMTLLLQAAESLQHQIVEFDAHLGQAVMRVDFSLRALSTFRVHAETSAQSADETDLRLIVQPGFKLGMFTGVGQSERVGWQLIGKMQEILDPVRYRQLEDEVAPSQQDRLRHATHDRKD